MISPLASEDPSIIELFVSLGQVAKCFQRGIPTAKRYKSFRSPVKLETIAAKSSQNSSNTVPTSKKFDVE